MSSQRQTKRFEEDPKFEAVSTIYEIVTVILKRGKNKTWNGRFIMPEDIRKYFDLDRGAEPQYLEIRFRKVKRTS